MEASVASAGHRTRKERPKSNTCAKRVSGRPGTLLSVVAVSGTRLHLPCALCASFCTFINPHETVIRQDKRPVRTGTSAAYVAKLLMHHARNETHKQKFVPQPLSSAAFFVRTAYVEGPLHLNPSVSTLPTPYLTFFFFDQEFRWKLPFTCCWGATCRGFVGCCGVACGRRVCSRSSVKMEMWVRSLTVSLLSAQ